MPLFVPHFHCDDDDVDTAAAAADDDDDDHDDDDDVHMFYSIEQKEKRSMC